MTRSFRLRIGIISVARIISVVIGGHFGGGDHLDGGDHFGGGTKVPVFNIPARSRIPASPSLLTPATRATPISETLHSNFRMSSE